MQALTLLEKQKIVEEYRCGKAKNKIVTQHAPTERFKEALNLEKVTNQLSIRHIMKNATKSAAVPLVASAATKRRRLAAVRRLERALFQWQLGKINSGKSLNGDTVKFHATNLLNDTNALLLENEEIWIKFSNV